MYDEKNRAMYSVCANRPTHRKQAENLEDIRNHDMPLGGKLDDCFTPSCVMRMNFNELRPAQCPFQCFRACSTSASPMSGSQNPVLNSFSSVSVRWLKSSSRRVGGRPFRRSDLSCAISSSSRWMHLQPVSLGVHRANARNTHTSGSSRQAGRQSRVPRQLEQHHGSIECAPLIES